MSMILVFDLDDTLYDERTYVESGLGAVAAFGHERFGWPEADSIQFMIDVLDRDGRGAIFDRWLAAHGKFSRGLVTACVQVYRNHTPHLKPNAAAAALLPTLAKTYPLYLVTDGNKQVQQKKVEALGIAPQFRKVFITHRYGVAHAKPSPYCFELIRRRETCAWADLAYIGDNPQKDFVTLNRMGAQTVRVLTGGHRGDTALPGYEARFSIATLGQLPDVLAAF